MARDPETGRRLHRVGLLGMPGKNGKSGVALAEADEGPAGGEVYCCAGDKDQARIVFRTARQMVEMDPELAARVKPYKDELVWPDTETRLKVLSAEAFTKEGLNPTFVLFDEVHVQPDDELWDVMEQAMGAREEPLMIGNTTAGDPTDRHGNDSLCYRLMKRGPEATVRTKRLIQWVPGKLAAFPAGAWEAIEAAPDQRPPAGDKLLEFNTGSGTIEVWWVWGPDWRGVGSVLSQRPTRDDRRSRALPLGRSAERVPPRRRRLPAASNRLTKGTRYHHRGIPDRRARVPASSDGWSTRERDRLERLRLRAGC